MYVRLTCFLVCVRVLFFVCENVSVCDLQTPITEYFSFCL